VFRGASDPTSSASSLPDTPVVPPAGISTAAPTISTSTPNSNYPPTPSAADLDHSDRSHSHSTSLPRIFNIDAHISHLQRDIQQLERLGSNVEATLGRTVHRIKERLGRRVWSGKDVWLADEQARVPVTKEVWREVVNFVTPEGTKLPRGQSRRQNMHQP
jgi:hypothetical protein